MKDETTHTEKSSPQHENQGDITDAPTLTEATTDELPSEVTSKLQNVVDSVQFELDRLDFDLNRQRSLQKSAMLDTSFGFLTGATFSVLFARVYRQAKPIDCFLYRNRFLVPKLNDYVARLFNVYPFIFMSFSAYSLSHGVRGLRDWRETSTAMITTTTRMEEKRHFQKTLAQRFDLKMRDFSQPPPCFTGAHQK